MCTLMHWRWYIIYEAFLSKIVETETNHKEQLDNSKLSKTIGLDFSKLSLS